MGRGAGGGASGGMGGGALSNAAIKRLASQTPTDLSVMSPMNNPRVLKGELSKTSDGYYVTQIEYDVRKVLDQSPARPKTTKGNAAFVKAYDVYHEKVNDAYKKAISDYKKELGKAKSKTEKIFMAKKVVQYQEYLASQPSAKDWIHKKFKVF
jgi:hypothetical protein